jgi:hypothetical protein
MNTESNESHENITSVPKYKTPLTKSWVLRKLIVVINLMIVGVVFTILSFKRENLFMFHQGIYCKV